MSSWVSLFLVAVSTIGCTKMDSPEAADLAVLDAAVGHDGPLWTRFDATVPVDFSMQDLPPPSGVGPPPDMWSGVLNVMITAGTNCVITTDPPMFTVHAGTSFTATFWNLATSRISVDISTDGGVPITTGLPPGQSFSDPARIFCGMMVPATFNFVLDGCSGAGSYSMPINCNG